MNLVLFEKASEKDWRIFESIPKQRYQESFLDFQPGDCVVIDEYFYGPTKGDIGIVVGLTGNSNNQVQVMLENGHVSWFRFNYRYYEGHPDLDPEIISVAPLSWRGDVDALIDRFEKEIQRAKNYKPAWMYEEPYSPYQTERKQWIEILRWYKIQKSQALTKVRIYGGNGGE